MALGVNEIQSTSLQTKVGQVYGQNFTGMREYCKSSQVFIDLASSTLVQREVCAGHRTSGQDAQQCGPCRHTEEWSSEPAFVYCGRHVVPEADDKEPSLRVLAFGEGGGPPTNPGPLIRAPEGTDLHVTVHNQFTKTVCVHGFPSTPVNAKDFFALEPGETRTIESRTGPAGTYYYWASLQAVPIVRRGSLDSQLAGAFIVDPPGAAGHDRVFVIG